MCDGDTRTLDAGTWNGSAHWEGQGGQVMRFMINNVNVLGTTISINAPDWNQTQSQIIPPGSSTVMEFSAFGREPMYWRFDTSSDSDAFIVAWELCSDWLPGDPPNG